MKQKFFIKIMVFVTILLLILISSHFLIHHYGIDEAHCLICQLLSAGLITPVFFEIIVLLILILNSYLRKLPINSIQKFLCPQLRAPPSF